MINIFRLTGTGINEYFAMKPYKELTRLGRLRRIRNLAELALEGYGLSGAQLTFLHSEGNIIFRVDPPGRIRGMKEKSLFLENRYVMRVLTTSHFDGVKSELVFLDAMRKEDLPVPAPVPMLDGNLLTTISTPGVPTGKIVSLMRWVDGRRLSQGLRPTHFRALGQMMARLHEFAAIWQPPDDFERPIWDWEGQLGGRYFDDSIEELVASMPKKFQEPFKIVSGQAREVMQELGKGTDAYGLIHSDLYPENVLFKAGEVLPIDFEDCGYGYWIWDMAIPLSVSPWDAEWGWMRGALLDGYSKIRTLPDLQLKYLDLFIATHCATMVLWASMFIKNDPAMQIEHEKWRNREGNKLLCYFEVGKGT